jgi:hypothetical protein
MLGSCKSLKRVVCVQTFVDRMAYPQWVDHLIRPPDIGGHVPMLVAYFFEAGLNISNYHVGLSNDLWQQSESMGLRMEQIDLLIAGGASLYKRR